MLHVPDRARRGRADLQPARRSARTKLRARRRDDRRHLPRPDHQVERPTHRGAQPRRQAARRRTSSWCTAPTARAPPSSSPTTCPRCRRSGRPRSARATSVNWPIGLGGKGNEGVTQQVKQTEGAIGYVELIYALSNKLPYADDQERGRAASSTPTLEVGDRGRGRAPSSRRTPTSGCRSPTRRAPRPTRSRRSPGSWSSRTIPDAGQGQADQGLPHWMLSPEAQRMAADLQLRPAAGRRDRADPASGSRPRGGVVTHPLHVRDGIATRRRVDSPPMTTAVSGLAAPAAAPTGAASPLERASCGDRVFKALLTLAAARHPGPARLPGLRALDRVARWPSADVRPRLRHHQRLGPGRRAVRRAAR